MTVYPGHFTAKIDAETAFGTAAGSPLNMRFDELVLPNVPGQQIDNPNLGHEHMADTVDRPLHHYRSEERRVGKEC